MARIPQDVIEDIIARTDIVQLIQSHIPLKKSGQNYSCCCPFHDEKTPSFTVSPKKQFYYCFGCGKHGNALSFLLEYKGQSFTDACQSLADLSGIRIPEDSSTQNQSELGSKQHQKEKAKASQPITNALLSAQSFFFENLQNLSEQHPAKKYLKNRNITEASISNFGIGYAPAGWDRLYKHLNGNHIKIADALEGGILAQSNQRVYDRFRDRIIFPIHNRKGDLIGFGGRSIGKDKPKYLNSPESPLFEKQKELYGFHQASNNCKKDDPILVTEGYFDTIRLHQVGISNAVATLGTSTSAFHIRQLFNYTNTIIFCFDGDQAGKKAAFRALCNTLGFINETKECKFLWLPEGEDPDSYVNRSGKAAFLSLMNQASSLQDFFFSELCHALDLNKLEDRAKLAKRAIEHIQAIQSPIYKMLMLEQLATLTRLQTSQLEALSESPKTKYNAREKHQDADSPTNLKQKKQSRWHDPKHSNTYKDHAKVNFSSNLKPSIVESLIRLVLNEPKLAQTQLDAKLRTLKLSKIDVFWEIYDLFQNKPSMSIAYLMGLWHNTSKGETLTELAAKEFLLERQHTELEFHDALRQLEIILIDNEIERALAADSIDMSLIQDLLKNKHSPNLTKSES